MRPHPATALATALTALLAVAALAADGFAQRGDRAARRSAPSSTAQDPEDWPDVVEKANNHRRYALRRAAANRLAKGGAAAVPAIRAFVAKDDAGANALDLLVVEAVAHSDSAEPAVVELLAEWARDRDFYWRAQALSGLARRKLTDFEPLFVAATDDPSHLYRAAGAEGLVGLGGPERLDRVTALLRDPDPRTRVRVACTLAEAGHDRGFEELVRAAQRRDHEFMGDPWGGRDLELAAKALGEVADTKFEWRRDAAELERMRKWAATHTGRAMPDVAPVAEPVSITDPATTGGFEIRSCRNGDLFVRWDATRIAFGLSESTQVVTIPPQQRAVWADHRAALQEILGAEMPRGRIVCDFLRIGAAGVENRSKLAPGNAPAVLADWLNATAAFVEESEGPESVLAAQLATRTPQFAPPSDAR